MQGLGLRVQSVLFRASRNLKGFCFRERAECARGPLRSSPMHQKGLGYRV